MNGREWTFFRLAGMVVAGFCLSRFAQQFWEEMFFQIHTYVKYGIHYESGVTPGQDSVHLTVLAICIVIWSWVDGFVFGQLRAWLPAGLFYFMVQGGYYFYLGGLHRPGEFIRHLLPIHPVDLLFVPAAAFGFWCGRRGVIPNIVQGGALLGTLCVGVALLVWTETWYQAVFLPLTGGVHWFRILMVALAASLPAGFVVTLPNSRRTPEE